MTAYRLISEPRADLDIEAAFDWYEKEQTGLGQQFLDEVPLNGCHIELTGGYLVLTIEGSLVEKSTAYVRGTLAVGSVAILGWP